MELDKKVDKVIGVVQDALRELEELKADLVSFKETTDNKAPLTSLIVEEEDEGINNSDIIRDYQEGCSAQDIQHHYGVSSGTLYSILRRNGVGLRTGTTPTERKIEDMDKGDLEGIITEYRLGTPNAVIQNTYGINKHMLYAILDTFGVEGKE